MDESIQKQLDQFDRLRITTLSEAIRVGHELIGENRHGFLACGAGCALGAAWVGTGRTEDEYTTGSSQIFHHLNRVLGVPYDVLNDVSYWHYQGEPRLKIADRLESMGY